MAIREILSIDSGRKTGEMTAAEILAAPHLLTEVMGIAINEAPPMNWRAARAVEISVEQAPELLDEIEPEILHHLESLQEQVMRGFLKIYKKKKTKISEDAANVLLAFCFTILNNQGSATAVKLYASQILEKIAKVEPDIIPELIQTLYFQAETDETAYARSAKNIIKNLEKLQLKR